ESRGRIHERHFGSNRRSTRIPTPKRERRARGSRLGARAWGTNEAGREDDGGRVPTRSFRFRERANQNRQRGRCQENTNGEKIQPAGRSTSEKKMRVGNPCPDWICGREECSRRCARGR